MSNNQNNQSITHFSINSLKTLRNNWKRIMDAGYNLGTVISLFNSRYRNRIIEKLNLINCTEKSIKAFVRSLKACKREKDKSWLDITQLENIIENRKEWGI